MQVFIKKCPQGISLHQAASLLYSEVLAVHDHLTSSFSLMLLWLFWRD